MTDKNWKDWLDHPGLIVTSYTYPIYKPISQEWIVYEPNSDNYTIVSNEEYMKYWNERHERT